MMPRSHASSSGSTKNNGTGENAENNSKAASDNRVLLTYVRKRKLSPIPLAEPKRETVIIKKEGSQNPNGNPPFMKIIKICDDGDKAVIPNSSNLMMWVCTNSACRASVPKDISFCKRCSCCICHQYDDNKDPSLWLVCEAGGSDNADFCGSSCHLECAFRQNLVGVCSIGNVMNLDGSYCCFTCGKISGILGCWRRQLMVAKEARRIDVLCHRIDLSYKLLEGTRKFFELHEIVKIAKCKLESEVGPLDGNSATMVRGIASRLPVANEVHNLCISAINMADELLSNASSMDLIAGVSSPAACKFKFEEITPTSVTLHVIETGSAISNDIKGYKLWCFKNIRETPHETLHFEFLRSQRKMRICFLKPCTEYKFRVISFTETGDLGHSHATCFTQSIEILPPSIGGSSNRRRKLESFVDTQSSAPNGMLGMSSEFKITEYVKNLAAKRANGGCRNALQIFSTPEMKLGGVMLPVKAEPEEAASNDMGKLTLGARSKKEEEEEEGKGVKKGIKKEEEEEEGVEEVEKGVRMIRKLEREGYVDGEFRLKFLTWYSMRSTMTERRIVSSFIENLKDEPKNLADQLRHSFSDIVFAKCPGN